MYDIYLSTPKNIIIIQYVLLESKKLLNDTIVYYVTL